jgi:hypothetical protein
MNIPGDPAISPFAVVEPPSAAAPDGGFQLFGNDGLTFRDFIDIINPLQHIPIVSTIYRSLTDDTLDHAPRVAGGAVFGGPIGALAGLINVIFEEATGKDVGEHVMALFDDAPATDEETKIAANTPEAALVTAAGPVPPMPAWATQALTPSPVEARVPSPPTRLPRPQYVDILGLPPAPAAAPAITASAATPVPRGRVEPKGPPPVNSTVVASLRQAENEADVFAAARFRSTLVPEKAKNDTPPGATATAGGWFSETMLGALEKYQKGLHLAANDATPSVSIEN